MPNFPPPPAELLNVLAALAGTSPARRGSVTERFMKCGRAGCACHVRDEARHGPYVTWSRVVDGKTKSFYVDAAHADVLRSQVQAGQALRGTIDDLWDALERWADTQLADPADASPETAEKGGSNGRSKRASKPK